MTREKIREVVLRVLGGIAPEADLTRVKSTARLRDQLDIDSMDLLNFVIGLHREFGTEIPEADYPKLGTLEGCIDYFMIHQKAD